jgi:hypothetical protein
MFEFLIGVVVGAAVVVVFPKIYNFLFAKYTDVSGE